MYPWILLPWMNNYWIKKNSLWKFKHYARKNIANLSKNSGYWNKLEHNKFIEALYLNNCNWIKIEKHLKNRTYKQIRSHAQKFYVKLKSFKDDVDFTSSYIKSLKDIILLINEKRIKY